MEEIKISIPDGYKINIQNSDLNKGIIKLEQNNITYDDICKKLDSLYNDKFYIDMPNQLSHKFQAIVYLFKTAYYLNKGWEPNWDNEIESKYYFFLDHKKININRMRIHAHSICYFKSRELAEKAIEILGEDTIRLALS